MAPEAPAQKFETLQLHAGYENAQQPSAIIQFSSLHSVLQSETRSYNEFKGRTNICYHGTILANEVKPGRSH